MAFARAVKGMPCNMDEWFVIACFIPLSCGYDDVTFVKERRLHSGSMQECPPLWFGDGGQHGALKF